MRTYKNAPKTLALLVYLAWARGTQTEVRAARIAYLLWGHRIIDPTRDLRKLVSRARKRHPGIVLGDAPYSLGPTVETDLEGFSDAVAAQDIEAALLYYKGDFFTDLVVGPGSADFEIWTDLRREEYRNRLLDLGTNTATRLRNQGRESEAAALAVKVLKSAPEADAEDERISALHRLTSGLGRQDLSLKPRDRTETHVEAVEDSAAQTTRPSSGTAFDVPPQRSALFKLKLIAGAFAMAVVLVTAFPVLRSHTFDNGHDDSYRAVFFAQDSLGRTWTSRISLPADESAPDRHAIAGTEFRRYSGSGFPHSLSTSNRFVSSVPQRNGQGTAIAITGWNSINGRVISDGGENFDPAWSPDGRWLVFSSDRVASGSGRVGLFVMSPDSGRPRVLTSPNGRDESPRWSVDGSRIAFSRRDPQGAEYGVCTVTLVGDEWCADRKFGPAGLRILGWVDAEWVVALVRTRSGGPIVLISTLGRPDSILATGVFNASLSQDGEWIGWSTQLGAGALWQVARMQSFSTKKVVELPASYGGATHLLWAVSSKSRRWLERLFIEENTRSRVTGDSVQLSAHGITAAGDTVDLRSLIWHSLDPRTASVDSTGLLHLMSPGSVSVVVTAGGWRSDTLVATVTAATSSLVMEENWQAAGYPNWLGFGDPRPEIATRGGESVLLPNGDQFYESGVYSKSSWDVSRGLHARLSFKLLVTGDHAQRIRIMLAPLWDSPAARRWDRKTGAQPVAADDAADQCGFHYPAYEGDRYRQIAAFAAGTQLVEVPISAATTAGTHTVTLSVSPDGTCRTSLDDTVRWESAVGAISTRKRYWLTIMGTSVGTEVAVGTVKVSVGPASR